MNAYRKAHSDLLQIASALVRGNMSGLSPYDEDMPKSTPIKVMRMIQDEAERQRGLGLKLRQASDVLLEAVEKLEKK